MQRDKNGNMNNATFYAVSSSSPYGYLCPKLKTQSQNTEVTSVEHRTQSICIQNTMSHIGFRNILFSHSDVSAINENSLSLCNSEICVSAYIMKQMSCNVTVALIV